MEKIFDPEVEKYLLDAKVSKKEIARMKFEVIKPAVIGRLQAIIELIKKDQYSKIDDYVSHSPAGDCMGTDKNFIDFSDLWESKNNEGEDITDACAFLNQLKEQMK